MARRYTINAKNPDPDRIQEVAQRICEGEIIILPTDTAYGLTGNPTNASVVQRIIRVKGRTSKLGMPLLANNLSQAHTLVKFSKIAQELATHFWPGALTIIVPALQTFPPGILGPHNSLAIRVPNHPVALAVIQATGFAIIGTSANRSDTTSPRTAEAAEAQIGQHVDVILDAGPTQHTADSTIVDCTRSPPKILREGAIPINKLQSWLSLRD
jgi:L-threonylcarbamoyladenylate synthase